MTYFNIAIIVMIVFFDLIVLKFVWIILTSKNVTQLEAAVTSFVLIGCAVVMSYTSAVTVVYADEPQIEVRYKDGQAIVPNRTYSLWNGATTYHKYGSKKYRSKVSHSKYHNKYHNRDRMHRTSKHSRPKLVHTPVKK